MQRNGPLITLLVGLATAVALLTLTMRLTPNEATPQGSTATSPSPSATTAGPETSSPPTPTSTQPESGRATYAGRIDRQGATIAVAVHDGKAIAYVCDGRRVEAWLLGTSSAGKLDLSSVKGAHLTGSYRDDVATGTVVIGERGWSFQVPMVRPPSGLYRAAATVGNAKIVGGWIVLADGTQVGVLSRDMVPAPAPSLNTSTRGTTVDGLPVTAAPIDGTTGSGF